MACSPVLSVAQTAFRDSVFHDNVNLLFKFFSEFCDLIAIFLTDIQSGVNIFFSIGRYLLILCSVVIVDAGLGDKIHFCDKAASDPQIVILQCLQIIILDIPQSAVRYTWSTVSSDEFLSVDGLVDSISENAVELIGVIIRSVADLDQVSSNIPTFFSLTTVINEVFG